MVHKAKDFQEAVNAIVNTGKDTPAGIAYPFTVRLVAPDKQADANEAFAGDAELMGRYVRHIEDNGQDETFVVDSGDAELGTILVMYLEDDKIEVYHT